MDNPDNSGDELLSQIRVEVGKSKGLPKLHPGYFETWNKEDIIEDPSKTDITFYSNGLLVDMVIDRTNNKGRIKGIHFAPCGCIEKVEGVVYEKEIEAMFLLMGLVAVKKFNMFVDKRGIDLSGFKGVTNKEFARLVRNQFGVLIEEKEEGEWQAEGGGVGGKIDLDEEKISRVMPRLLKRLPKYEDEEPKKILSQFEEECVNLLKPATRTDFSSNKLVAS